MTTDTRTTNRQYALPYPSNLLAADVVRLREALNAIDADIADRPTAATVTAEVNAAVAALVAAAPEAMNTLDELAAALSDDDNFAGTVTASLATKLDKTGGVLSGQITLPNNPSAGTLQAATAVYVENSHSTWVAVDNAASPYASTSNVRLLVDTTAGAVTVTLPAAPTVGDYVEIIDAAGTFDTNNLTVGRNSLKIMSLDEDMTVSKINASFKLVYASAALGWRIN
jgi:hypothetical protein